MYRRVIPTFVLFFASAHLASAQGFPLLIPPSNYAVEGAPFTAIVEATWERPASDQNTAPQEQPQLTRILRDHAGRERFEPVAAKDAGPATQPVRATIYDIPAARIFRLNFTAHTFNAMPIENLGRATQIDPAVASALPPLSTRAGQTLLGLRTIAGIEAWGQRLTLTSTNLNAPPTSSDREVWTSTHYRIPVQLTRQDGPRGRLTMTVTSFDPSEPDPALFQIPAGFTELALPPPKPATDSTYRVGNGVSAPVPIKIADPEYSENARREKISGSVLVALVVDVDGNPAKVHVVRGLGHGLDEKAIEAVSAYRFKPAMLAGSPVPVALNIEVNFQIFGKP